MQVSTYSYDIMPVTVNPVGAPNLHVEHKMEGPSEYKLYLIQVCCSHTTVPVI